MHDNYFPSFRNSNNTLSEKHLQQAQYTIFTANITIMEKAFIHHTIEQ